jgi:hypothetical protein
MDRESFFQLQARLPCGARDDGSTALTKSAPASPLATNGAAVTSEQRNGAQAAIDAPECHKRPQRGE